jgi:multidrug efflux pump
MRQTLGTAVFYGMLGVTIFGIFLTPVFYYVIRKIAGGTLAVHHKKEEPAHHEPVAELV